jgi:hypothetical protein
MSPLMIVVSAFMIALVVMSGAFMGGAVIVAVPVAIVVIAVMGFLDLRRRTRRVKPKTIEFTDRDRETLVSE